MQLIYTKLSGLLTAIVGVSSFLLLIGALVFAESLKLIVPSIQFVGMSALLCLVLVALGLLSSKVLRIWLGWAVIIIASFVMLQFALNFCLVDSSARILIHTIFTVSESAEWPGRMSFISAISFFLLGLVMVKLEKEYSFYDALMLQVLIGLLVGMAFVSLYVVPENNLHDINRTLVMNSMIAVAMLLHTLRVVAIFASTKAFSTFYLNREDRQIFSCILIVILLMFLATGLDEVWGTVQTVTGLHQTDKPELLDGLHYSGTTISLLLFLLGLTGVLTVWHVVRGVINKLRHQELLMTNVLNALPVGVWITDKTGNIVTGNPMAQEIWGGAELVGINQYAEYKGWWHDTGKLIAPEEWSLARAIQHGEISLKEIVDIACFDGSRKTIVNSGLPLKDAAGNITGAIAVNQDITENLSVAEELRQAKDLFQAMFELAPIGMGLVSPEGVFVKLNQAFCDMLGYRPDELLNLSIVDITHPNDCALSEQEFKRLLRGEIDQYQIEKKYLHKKGHEVITILNTALIKDKNGAPLYVIGQVEDVTQVKHSMYALKRWEDVFRHSRWGVVVGNAKNNTLELMNASFAEMHGYTVDELTGMSVSTVFSPSVRDSLLDHLEQARLQGHYLFESLHVRKDGTEFPVLIDITVVYDDHCEALYRIVNVQDITQRKLAENALRISEANLRRAQAVAHIGSWSLDVGRNILTWTDENYRIFGVPIGPPLTYETFLSCVHPDDRHYVEEQWRAALSGEQYDIEHRIIVNGEERWVRERAELEFDEEGVLIGCLGTTQDIHERKLARDARLQSEARLCEAERIAHLGSWEWDIAAGKQIWSDETYRIFGFTPGVDVPTYELFMSLLSEHDKRYVQEQVSLALDGKVAYKVEYQVRYADGSVRWVQSQAEVQRDHAGKPLRMIGTNLDVTELRQYENALMESEAKLRGLYELSPLGIALTDLNGKFVSFNESFRRICGYNALELETLDYWDLTPKKYERMEATQLKRLMKHGSYGPYEKEYMRKDGTLVPLRLNGVLVKGRDGQQYIWSIVEDISERREAEYRLQQSQARLQGIANNLPGMVFQLTESIDTQQLSFIYLNESVTLLFGLDSQLLFKDAALICQHIHFDDVASFNDTRLESAKLLQVWDWVGRIHPVRQEEKWVNLRAMPRREENGNVVWDGVILNITQSKNAEIALEESRQLLRELAAEDEAAREQERKRIAREVHDELGQTLTALRMDVSLLRMRFGAKDAELMGKVLGMTELVDRAIQSVRDVAANLRPAVLDMGIVSALEWLCDEFVEHSNIDCTVEKLAEFFKLDEKRSVGVFRIVQESLTNAARYSEATRVNILLDVHDSELVVEVRDNGKGFDQTTPLGRRSFGLLGMRERALALGGNVDIISSPGNGTVVSVCIPLE